VYGWEPHYCWQPLHGPNNSLIPSTSVLNEVVITANKLMQKQSQTGKVISVINKEQLEKSAGRNLGQVLNEQAGIVIPGALNAMGSPQTLSVRGSGPGQHPCTD
jgi:vitamin B12 transporter